MPYQGTGPALTDLVGGQVDFMCDQTTNTTGQIKAGEVKAYAVTSAERNAGAAGPADHGRGRAARLPVSVWHGLYVPAGTPAEVVAKLTEALKAALNDPAVVARFAELGTAPVAGEPRHAAGASRDLAAQIELWKPIIEAAGVQPQ